MANVIEKQKYEQDLLSNYTLTVKALIDGMKAWLRCIPEEWVNGDPEEERCKEKVGRQSNHLYNLHYMNVLCGVSLWPISSLSPTPSYPTCL